MTVSKLTAGPGLTEAAIRLSENTDSKEQRATTRQGIMRMLAYCEEREKERKRYLSRSA
jgi:hypothetical protein